MKIAVPKETHPGDGEQRVAFAPDAGRSAFCSYDAYHETIGLCTRSRKGNRRSHR